METVIKPWDQSLCMHKTLVAGLGMETYITNGYIVCINRSGR